MARNLSALLHELIPPAQLELIQRAADEAAALRLPIYLVGGFVRDLLLGRAGLDFDLVVEGEASALAQALAEKYGGRVTVHSKFGTAKWFLAEQPLPEGAAPHVLDLISARSETYRHPAALPTVKRGTLADDIRRRDFTINTLAVRLDGAGFGELRDEANGLEDLTAGRVRVLQPHSFLDDPTRMYRAVRYEQRYGFTIVPETVDLMIAGRSLVEKLSAQRIRHELDLMLDEPQAAAMLARLAELDLLRPIHLALRWDPAAPARLAGADDQGLPPAAGLRWLLWLMPLSSKELESLNGRLHFTAALYQSLLAASEIQADHSAWSDLKPSQCVEKLERFPLLAVQAVSLAGRPSARSEVLQRYLLSWRMVKPHTAGGDLKKLGLTAGPQYQSILRRLRNAWLDGEIANRDEELKLLDEVRGSA